MYARRDDIIARVQERETWNTGNTIHYRSQHIKLISTNTKQSHFSRIIQIPFYHCHHYISKRIESIYEIWIGYSIIWIGRRVTSLWVMQPQGTHPNRNKVRKFFSTHNPIWQSQSEANILVPSLWCVCARAFTHIQKYISINIVKSQLISKA